MASLRRLAVIFQPLARPLAGSRWFPFWAILRHTGRRSGSAYATPIVVFATAEGFVIPLPFGDRTQWLKNLVAAGHGGVRSRGRDHAVSGPVVVDVAAADRWLPRPIRWLARRIGIRQFVTVQLDVPI